MARILSVEDDEHVQHLIGLALYREGYEMHYAWNGQEGYERALAVRPDLLLLDLMLPMVNGIELLQRLREHNATRSVPVIVVTAFGDAADMLKTAVEALGAATYLRKPVDMAELVRCVRRVLAAHPAETPRPAPAELRKGAVRADPRHLTVWVNDRLLATLHHKQFAALRLLIESDGPVRREALMSALGYDGGQGGALKQVLHRLRRDFGDEESGRIRTTPDGYELLG